MTARVLMLCPDAQMIDRRVMQSAHSLDQAGMRVTLVSGVECAEEQHYRSGGVDVHRYVYDWHEPRLDFLRRVPRPLRRVVPLVHRVHRKWLQHLRRDTTWDHFVLRTLGVFESDLVYVHDLPFLRHGRRLAERWSVPLVFDAHEIYYEQDTFTTRERRRLRRMERRHLPKVDLFVTVNRFIADWYSERYPGLEVAVVHNSLPDHEPAERTTARRDLLAATGFDDDHVVVLFQGWLSAERNLRTMVAALDHVPQHVRLVVVGYGEHLDELRSLAAGLEHPERVCFLGRMEQDALLRLTPGADLGLIPYLPVDLNHRLCSPNKFFEFVQSGVPVLAHQSPFFLAMEADLGVVATGDLSTADGMARAIESLVSDPDRLARMARSCEHHRGSLAWEQEYPPVVDRCRQLACTPAQ